MLLPRAITSLALNGMPIGFLPQTGDLLTPLNAVLNKNNFSNAATYGVYAQTFPGNVWDGSQLYAVMSDVVASGAIFEPVIMPMNTWQGYTEEDNSQAVAIAQVLNKFSSIGIDVRLRFAHEANWYSSAAGNYTYGQGSTDPVGDFKTAFQVVASACARIAPGVQLVYSPNIANLAEYELWAPNASTYDFVSIDYYPDGKEQLNATQFISRVKPFHDEFTANSTKKFIVAEAGLHLNLGVQDRVGWLQTITSTEVQEALPNLVSVTWYNDVTTDFDFQILDTTNATVNAPLLQALAASPNNSIVVPGTQQTSDSHARAVTPVLLTLGLFVGAVVLQMTAL